MKIKVMTYNIYSCNEYKNESVINPTLFAKVIKEYDPDIVGLNEVHGEGGIYGDQVKEIAEYLGYPYYYFAPAIMAGESEYGNAFISKYPIVDKSIVHIPDPEVKDEDVYYETRCIAKMTVRFDKDVDVLVTHFGLAESERSNAVKTVKELVDNTKNMCIVMGDFNSEPQSSHLNELKGFLKDTASVSTENILTYSSDNPYEKIDYIMTSPSMKVIECGVINSTTSDHKPYYAVVEI